MENQEFRLDFIEKGRMSDNEMGGIYGGAWSCGTYTNCHKEGKHVCKEYLKCADINDPNNRLHCKEQYKWVAEFIEDDCIISDISR